MTLVDCNKTAGFYLYDSIPTDVGDGGAGNNTKNVPSDKLVNYVYFGQKAIKHKWV